MNNSGNNSYLSYPLQFIAKQLYFFFTIFFFLIVYGCEDGLLSHFHGTGEITTEIRYIDGFNKIEIHDDIEVSIIPHSDFAGRLVLSGGENLLPKIETSKNNSTLSIKNNNQLNWIRNYSKSNISIELHIDTITNIIYSGIGNITFLDTLTIKNFTYESIIGMGTVKLSLSTDSTHIILHTGSTDVFPIGKSNYSHFYQFGSGIVNGKDFEVQNQHVHNRGTNNCYTNPISSLGVTIESSGNVFYKNNPEILWLKITGSGELIKY